MRNLLPNFIAQKFTTGETSGFFDADTMFVDISGFTAMTQKLMANGKEGAEVLSDIINRIFTPAIDAIHHNKGFIATFAGDAFTSIFHKNASERTDALRAAWEVKKIFDEMGTQHTKFGDFELSVKIGVSCGNVEWRIFGDEKRGYYFRGKAIDDCAACEHHCEKGDIVISNKYLDAIESYNLQISLAPKDEQHFAITGFDCANKNLGDDGVCTIDRSVCECFLPSCVQELRVSGEFRDIVTCFISFAEKGDYNGGITKVLELCEKFGGYFNKTDFGDKGGVMLILFGAPSGAEKLFARACDFALAVRGIENFTTRIGITFGTAFAGFVGCDNRAEYTALGMTVNFAARLMMLANFGEIFADRHVWANAKNEFDFAAHEPHVFKGFSEPLPYFELLARKKRSQTTLFNTPFLGNEKQLHALSAFLNPLRRNLPAGFAIIEGNAGTGKSRLLAEALATLDFPHRTITLYADEILRKTLSPVVVFLMAHFDLPENMTEGVRAQAFEQKFVALHKTIIEHGASQEFAAELFRVRSILGSLLGLRWDGSIFELIDPKDRPQAIRMALNTFFASLAFEKPCVIIFEDSQWLDSETLTLLHTLRQNTEKMPFAIVALARTEDEIARNALTCAQLDSIEIRLENFDAQMTTTLVAELLHDYSNAPLAPSLVQFIFDRTDGNPFYIEQFCLYLAENQTLALNDNNELSLKTSVREIPANVNAVMIARIDKLSAQLKDAVLLASVLGREFELQILSALLAHFSQSEMRTYDEAVPTGEAERIWHSLSTMRYIFAHALMRDAAYEMQLRKRLVMLHELTATFIVQLYGQAHERFSEIAFHFSHAEKFDEAVNYYLKAGDFSRENYRLTQAKRYFNLALDCAHKIYDEHAVQVGEIYFALGKTHDAAGEYDAALDFHTRAREILASHFGEDSAECARSDYFVGYVLSSMGEYDGALTCVARATQIREKLFGKDAEVIAECAILRSNIYHYRGEYDLAVRELLQALDIRHKLVGELDKGTAECYNNLGVVFWTKGELDDAESNFSRALEIHKQIFGEKHPHTASSFHNIAMIYFASGDFEKAIDYLSRALEIRKDVFGEFHPDTASTYDTLGAVFHYMDDFEKAVDNMQHALASREKLLGEHPATADSLHNIGMAYLYEDPTLAEQYLLRAAKIRESVLGTQHPECANSLQACATVCNKLGKYEQAREFASRALESFLQLFGEDNADTAASFFALGQAQLFDGNLDNAIDNLSRAFDFRISDKCDDKFIVPATCAMLSTALCVRGEYTSAANIAERALAAFLPEELDDTVHYKILVRRAYAEAASGAFEVAEQILPQLDALAQNLDVIPEQGFYELTLAHIAAQRKKQMLNCTFDCAHNFELATQMFIESENTFLAALSMVEYAKAMRDLNEHTFEQIFERAQKMLAETKLPMDLL